MTVAMGGEKGITTVSYTSQSTKTIPRKCFRLVFVESVVSGVKDGPAVYPNPFVLSSELSNLEPLLERGSLNLRILNQHLKAGFQICLLWNPLHPESRMDHHLPKSNVNPITQSIALSFEWANLEPALAEPLQYRTGGQGSS